jgi:death-on-curing protein
MFGEPLHKSVAEMASALCFGLAKNHAFQDGNKRVALTTAASFVASNVGRPLHLETNKWIALIERAAGSPDFDRRELTEAFMEAMGGDLPITQ